MLCQDVLHVALLFCCFTSTFASQQQKPAVLFLHHNHSLVAGMEHNVCTAVATFINNGHQAWLVVQPNSKIEQLAATMNIPTIPCSHLSSTEKKLADYLAPICSNTGAKAVFCQNDIHLGAVHLLKQRGCKIASILTIHMSKINDLSRFLTAHGKEAPSGPDAIICLNHYQLEALSALEKSQSIQLNNVMLSGAFFPENRCKNIIGSPQAQPKLLKEFFGIDTQNKQAFCMIGYMIPRFRKGHLLLLDALKIIDTTTHEPFLCIFAGEGAGKVVVEEKVKELGLEDKVVFVGYTDKIPELINGCNFNVLASTNEAYGIVHVEAGFLSRASIGATKTGAEGIIIDGVTGLLFENNNAIDLAEKLRLLLRNKNLQETLGKNAAVHIRQHLSNQVIYQQHVDLLNKLGS